MGIWQQAIANRQARIANQGIMDNSAGFNNSRFLNQRSQQGSIGNALRAAQNGMSVMGIGGLQSGVVGSVMRGRNIGNQNQLAPTSINPNAFNTGTVGQVFNQNYIDPVLSQKKSSPIKQTIDNSVDPLTGQFIDPTVGQGINPDVVDPVPPPVGVEQNTIVPYEINNQ